MKFLGSKISSADDSVWISSSDLMSGLMIIFLFISVAFIRQQAPTVIGVESFSENYLDGLFELERSINFDLDREFSEEEKNNWNMEIIPEQNLIRFRTPDILFKQNSDELAPTFENILAEFFPRYIEVLSRYENIFKEIRIEGHTSSEWSGLVKEKAFIKNMALSQNRTRAVFEFCMQLILVSENQKHIDFIYENISAAGMSSRDLIYKNNGDEDPNLSRRVEFRHLFDERKYLQTVSNYLNQHLRKNSEAVGVSNEKPTDTIIAEEIKK